jgi:hypothetical protein
MWMEDQVVCQIAFNKGSSDKGISKVKDDVKGVKSSLRMDVISCQQEA